MTEHANSIESTNLELGSSHIHPVPIGVSIKTKIERGDAYSAPEIFDLEIAVLEILRGQDAWDRIQSQCVSDVPPQDGFEYILAYITFGYYRRGRGFGDAPYVLQENQFIAMSEDGQTQYKTPSVQEQPQPRLVGEQFSPGESREGWILLQVPKEEMQPRLIFNREYDEGVYGIWGYVWFQLFAK